MSTSITLTVGGTEYTDAKSITSTKTQGDDNSTSRLTASFDNYNGIHSSSFTEGDEVTLEADGTQIFTGTLTEIAFEGKGSVKEIIRLLARDFGSLLQRTTVEPEVYTDTEVSVIVEDICRAPAALQISGVEGLYCYRYRENRGCTGLL